jgi:lysophospholipase
MRRFLSQPSILITIVLLSTMLRSTELVGQPNSYSLTTEAAFEIEYRDRVLPYWNKGKVGTFEGKDQLRIAYRTFLIEDRQHEKGAIVISSGRTEGLIKYQELINDLGRQGYSIYIHDHRGQGFSDRVIRDPASSQIGHVDSFDDYVADLKQFVNSVVMPRQHKRRFLLAHSMGGAIASLYLERYANDFAAAVLSSPMHEPSTGWVTLPVACAVADWKDVAGMERSYALGKGPYDAAEAFDARTNVYTHSQVTFNSRTRRLPSKGAYVD